MTKPTVKSELIAPCGMDCATCMAFLRDKNDCLGCRIDESHRRKSCDECSIKNCARMKAAGWKFCTRRCEAYPCRRLKTLDKRYRTRYHMSMIENLEAIEECGIRAFVRDEKERWACPECGGLICVHTGRCASCGSHQLE